MWHDLGSLPDKWIVTPVDITWNGKRGNTRVYGARVSSDIAMSNFNIPRLGGTFSRRMFRPEADGLVYFEEDTLESEALRAALAPGGHVWGQSVAEYSSRIWKTRKSAMYEDENYKPVVLLLDSLRWENMNQTCFLTAPGNKKIISLFNPMIPSVVNHTFPDCFEKSLLNVTISMQNEEWTGSARFASVFPEELRNPPLAKTAEADGTAVSLEDMDIRFRSLWGIHHVATHYFPEKNAFRVLTGRSSTGDEKGELQGCFPALWRGEDVFYFLFQDRYSGFARTLNVFNSKNWSKDIPAPEPFSGPVFEFLNFCDRKCTRQGPSILDKIPTNRVSGVRETRPLFFTLANGYLGFKNNHFEPDIVEKGNKESFENSLSIFAQMSKYVNMNLRWNTPDMEAGKSIRKSIEYIFPRKSGSKVRPASIDEKSARIWFGSTFCGRGEKNRWFRGVDEVIDLNSTKSALGDFLFQPETEESSLSVPFQSLFSPVSFTSPFSLTAVPVYDMKKGCILPRRISESAQVFLRLQVPELYFKICTGEPCEKDFLYTVLTREECSGSLGLSKFLDWSDKVSFYLPLSCPIPDVVFKKDIDERDALAFLQEGWASNILARLAYPLFLEYRRFGQGEGKYKGRKEKLMSFLLQGLVDTPEGRPPDEGGIWLGKFKGLVEHELKRSMEAEKSAVKQGFSFLGGSRDIDPLDTFKNFFNEVEAAMATKRGLEIMQEAGVDSSVFGIENVL